MIFLQTLVLDAQTGPTWHSFSPWHLLVVPEVSFGSEHVGPWVINLVGISCMSLLLVNVGTRACMIFTG